jgi:hypothetical protein
LAKTFLDELVEYPVKALRKIGTDPDVVKLLTDNPRVDMGSDEADDVFDKYLYDYVYVDSTTTEACAYVCVEAELIKTPTPTIQDLRLYVTVICHKNFMQIDPARFKALMGNRRDNLVRSIDKILNGSDMFGIGLLSLDSVKTVSSPTGFTARELTYKIADFMNKGVTRT